MRVGRLALRGDRSVLNETEEVSAKIGPLGAGLDVSQRDTSYL